MNIDTKNMAGQPIQPLVFMTVKDIYDAPQEEVNFCVKGLLPTGGMSVLAGKPKAGKSTLARQLAVAVAHGTPFLNRETEQGAVLYLGIEEKQSEVAAHFQQLGLCESDPVLIRCGAVPKNQSVAMLEDALMRMPEAKLVIIDPMFRFVGGVKDASDYVQVNNALEQLLELARRYNVHILTVHHMKKKETEDVMDGALGSTAIVGGTDTFIGLLVDGKGMRTICSRQRYGTDMEPTQLEWDSETRELSLGMTSDDANRAAADASRRRQEEGMINYVAAHEGCTQTAMLNAVPGKRASKLRVMQQLIDDKCFVQFGEGVKGDPYTYRIAELEHKA